MFKRSDVAAIVVDVQNAFCESGTLPAPGAKDILPVINGALQHFGTIVFTKDWHPANHMSFASQHAGAKPFSSIRINGNEQMLWPDHAVQGTPDADFHPLLDVSRANLIVLKGKDPQIDSYSAFMDNGGKHSTGLELFLVERNVKAIFLMGLTLEYCVKWTALDAVNLLNIPVYVMEDAVRPFIPAASEPTLKELQAAGVKIVDSKTLTQLVS